MWRSLVAHLTGGQGVAGSNPVIPTKFSPYKNRGVDLGGGMAQAFRLLEQAYQKVGG